MEDVAYLDISLSIGQFLFEVISLKLQWLVDLPHLTE